MQDGRESKTLARSRAVTASLVALVFAALAAPGHAQTPGTGVSEIKAPPKASAGQPPAAASEDLPWLATTKPANPSVATKAADAPPSKTTPATIANSGPASQAGTEPAKKAASACAEQLEDACRGMKMCAWVATIPLGDGNVVPARCAERKVFASDKPKKPKPAVAAKPKPKPEITAPLAKTETPPATVVTPSATGEPALQPTADNAVVTKTVNNNEAISNASPPAQPQSPIAETSPKQPTNPEPVKAEAPLMIPRAPVPFLPPEQPSIAAQPVQSQVVSAPAAPPVENKMASEKPTAEPQPMSIPGLVISE